MSTATLERFPRTVSACHAEIIRLRVSLENAQESSGADRIAELEAERDELEAKLEAAEEEGTSLQAEVDRLEKHIESFPDATEDINALLDECVRFGPLRYDVPQTPRAMRAIVNLHDCVGRQP